MSWRQYGGLNKLDKTNNITVNSIVTDTFTVRQAFLSTFNVYSDAYISGNTKIAKNLEVTEKITTSDLVINGNAFVGENLTIGNHFFTIRVEISY